MNDHVYINNEEVEQRTVLLHDGPLDKTPVIRPTARMRKTRHAKGFRMPDEQQPWQPGMPGKGSVLFAIYLWLPGDQAYGWVDFVKVSVDPCLGPTQLDQVCRVVDGQST